MRTSIWCSGITGALLIAMTTGVFAQAKVAGSDKPEAQIRSVKDLVDLVPKKTMQELKQKLKMEDARKAANEVFANQAKSRTGSFMVKAAGWDPWTGGGVNMEDKFRMTLSQSLNTGGLNIQVLFWIYFPAEQQAALAKTAKGKEMKVTGELAEVQFVNDPSAGLQLLITLFHAKID
jgi:hypothetical protein